MNSITWSDEMGSRSRKAWLLLIKGENIHVFRGENIPSVAAIRGSDFHKNGKWSHNTYRVELADGVRAIAGKEGWETGTFLEGLRAAVRFERAIDRWPDVSEALGVSVAAAMTLLRMWKPVAADKLDVIDVQLEALEEKAPGSESETIIVSFGGPTNASIASGFWKTPKGIPGHDGAEIRLLDPEKGWVKENVTVVGMTGTVLSAVHAAGYHGGYVTVTVAVIPGTEVPKVAAEPPSATIVVNPATSEPTPLQTPATLADLQAKFSRQ